ncbi:adenylyltransferase/cytidyltransferase family protein [Pseudomonadales bacterium]|nr:adenylyltransferase/cytidyltransferase family protein [Pseudomonadales bacterium]
MRLLGEEFTRFGKLRAGLKEKESILVATNGCFDIIHSGHVIFLQAAKRLGDKLLVLLNDDSSISELKGAGRPVNSFEDRRTVLEGLSCVDYVLPLRSNAPDLEYSKVLPDILVKGGDYKVNEIIGGAEVLEDGGRVVTVPYVEGRSTSNMIERIRSSK